MMVSVRRRNCVRPRLVRPRHDCNSATESAKSFLAKLVYTHRTTRTEEAAWFKAHSQSSLLRAEGEGVPVAIWRRA